MTSEDFSNIETNDNFFNYLLDQLNYKIFKCSSVFKKSKINDYLINIGFIVGIIIMIFILINIFIFYIVFLPKLRVQVFKLIPTKEKLFEKMRKYLGKKSELNRQNSCKKFPWRFAHINSHSDICNAAALPHTLSVGGKFRYSYLHSHKPAAYVCV